MCDKSPILPFFITAHKYEQALGARASYLHLIMALLQYNKIYVHAAQYILPIYNIM